MQIVNAIFGSVREVTLITECSVKLCTYITPSVVRLNVISNVCNEIKRSSKVDLCSLQENQNVIVLYSWKHAILTCWLFNDF